MCISATLQKRRKMEILINLYSFDQFILFFTECTFMRINTLI
jgi:hypothetical protein